MLLYSVPMAGLWVMQLSPSFEPLLGASDFWKETAAAFEVSAELNHLSRQGKPPELVLIACTTKVRQMYECVDQQDPPCVLSLRTRRTVSMSAPSERQLLYCRAGKISCSMSELYLH